MDWQRDYERLTHYNYLGLPIIDSTAWNLPKRRERKLHVALVHDEGSSHTMAMTIVIMKMTMMKPVDQIRQIK